MQLRTTAWALTLGGLFMVLNDVTHLGFERFGAADPAALAAHPVFLGHGATHVIFGVLVMLGLVGLGIHYAQRLGRFGRGAVVFAFMGQGLMLAMYAGFTLGASAAPDVFLAEEGPAGAFLVFAPIALFSGVLGLSLVGGVLARRDILSRPAGIALAVAGPAFIFVTVLPAGFEAIMGGAVLWLGLRFVQELAQPAPAPTAQAVPV